MGSVVLADDHGRAGLGARQRHHPRSLRAAGNSSTAAAPRSERRRGFGEPRAESRSARGRGRGRSTSIAKRMPKVWTLRHRGISRPSPARPGRRRDSPSRRERRVTATGTRREATSAVGSRRKRCGWAAVVTTPTRPDAGSAPPRPERVLEPEPGPLVLGHHVHVFGVPLEEGLHERAEGEHRGAALAQVVQGAGDERGADPLALEPVEDLGVVEGDALAATVVDEVPGELAVGADLVAILVGVVGDLEVP